jgi:transposase
MEAWMVTDRQVRRLFKTMLTQKTKASAAAKADMDEKTARKYVRLGKLPSETKQEHTWRTRSDPFADVWQDIKPFLENNHGLQAKTLFDYFRRQHPGLYSDGQLRTLQRRIKVWRALEGPAKEVFFTQVHTPGQLCQTDFTHMQDLHITIDGQLFKHLICHFVLTYSNWEAGTVCFSESFEALSEGMQNALWQLGAVPHAHQSDRMSAAINNGLNREEFTQRYQALLRHYGMEGRMIQSGKANENGDVEQMHNRFKIAVDQALMLRGSRDFENRTAYKIFLKDLLNQRNFDRKNHLHDEFKNMRRLPATRLDACRRLPVRVSKGSTINVLTNIYSVHSRLRDEMVNIRLYAEHLEVWYAQQCVDRMPRLLGRSKHKIQYRHIIEWLLRKPGAFENYRYRNDLFPTHRFRMAYDVAKEQFGQKGNKEYLKILYLAATDGEDRVDQALEKLISANQPITYDAVEKLVKSGDELTFPLEPRVMPVELGIYETLLNERMVGR